MYVYIKDKGSVVLLHSMPIINIDMNECEGLCIICSIMYSVHLYMYMYM